MGKNVSKPPLIDIVVGVIIGHISALSMRSGDVPSIHHEAESLSRQAAKRAPC